MFKWRQTAPELILCAVRWYLRYSLSLRDVEELVAEAHGEWGPRPMENYLYVNNADATYASALDAGATSVIELSDGAVGRSQRRRQGSVRQHLVHRYSQRRRVARRAGAAIRGAREAIAWLTTRAEIGEKRKSQIKSRGVNGTRDDRNWEAKSTRRVSASDCRARRTGNQSLVSATAASRCTPGARASRCL